LKTTFHATFSSNQVYRPFCTLDTVSPLVQLSGSVSSIQTWWIISLSAFTRLGPLLFQQFGPYRVQTGCFVVFQVFCGFKNFVMAWQIDNNIIFSWMLYNRMWLLSFKCCSKYSFHLDSTWSLLVSSWPFVARGL
jgi:hypothetical protein